MAQTIKKTQILQKVSETDTLVLHPETAADAVLYDNAASGMNAATLQEAVDELKDDIDAITGGGTVTGVKGEAETEYRTGKVNMTKGDIGLDKVDNTADTEKPVSTAQRKAIDDAVDAVDDRVTTLVGGDTGKSVRTIANEELAAQLIGEGAAESLDTLEEIAAWIQSHPEDAAAMNAAISALQAQLAGIPAGDGAVKTYIDGAIDALELGEYAKASELTALASRVTAVEGKATTNAADIAKLTDGTTSAGAAAKLSAARTLSLTGDATGSASFDGSRDASIAVTLSPSGVAEGTYSAVKVNAKGLVEEGAQVIEVGTAGQSTPSAKLAAGGIFFQMI